MFSPGNFSISWFISLFLTCSIERFWKKMILYYSNSVVGQIWIFPGESFLWHSMSFAWFCTTATWLFCCPRLPALGLTSSFSGHLIVQQLNFVDTWRRCIWNLKIERPSDQTLIYNFNRQLVSNLNNCRCLVALKVNGTSTDTMNYTLGGVHIII